MGCLLRKQLVNCQNIERGEEEIQKEIGGCGRGRDIGGEGEIQKEIGGCGRGRDIGGEGERDRREERETTNLCCVTYS
jgi:hypothetical protein